MTTNGIDLHSSNGATADCQWVRDQLPAHVIRALDIDDAFRVDEHVLLCRPCEAEHASWSSVVPLIGLAPRAVEPSPLLKQRIIANAQTRPARSGLAAPSARTLQPAPPPVTGVGRRWSRFAVLPVIAAMMVLALLAVSSQQQLSRERDRGNRLEGENAAITDSLLMLQTGRGESGNARWYPLLSVDASFAEAGGLVLGDPSQSTALLSVWNMPEKIGPYHVICESKFGELLAAGQLQVNDLGVGAITLNLPGPMTEYRVVHIVHGDVLDDGGDPRANDVLLVRLEDPTAVPEVE